MISETAQGVILQVFVQPRASRNGIVGRHGDALKLRLTAPPVDGAANKMCVKFMAKTLGVARGDVEVVAGQTSRTKRICIHWPASADSAGERQKFVEKITALLATKNP